MLRDGRIRLEARLVEIQSTALPRKLGRILILMIWWELANLMAIRYHYVVLDANRVSVRHVPA